MNDPINVPTRDTLEFVLAEVPSGASLIEVGCGRGELALAMQAAGLQVVAIDHDADAIAHASTLGVNAHHAKWPDFASVPVDAVLFSRSLHHINPLGDALQAARATLKPATHSGILVEDFEYHAANAKLIDWLCEVANRAYELGHATPGEEDFLTTLLSTADRLSAWHENHCHDLHNASEMQAALQAVVDSCAAQDAPYAYRYIERCLHRDTAAAEFLAGVLTEERELGTTGVMPLLGRRFIGYPNWK